MKVNYLFSHRLKLLGWCLFIIGLGLGITIMVTDSNYPNWEINVFPLIGDEGSFFSTPAFQWTKNNIADELASILLIIGGILVSFSKTKDEDEYISKIRTESLIWAVYVNYTILILAILFVFDMGFFSVLIYNMFTVLLFFMLRFHYVLYITRKSVGNEE
jgi:hypothetical protein